MFDKEIKYRLLCGRGGREERPRRADASQHIKIKLNP